jgi:6-phosphogluconate dehydrogenase
VASTGGKEMKIGFIGLGRMGKEMVLNMLDNKQQVVAHNRSPKPIKQVAKYGAIPAYSIEELCSKLGKKKIVWIMIKSGKPVDDTIKSLLPFLNKGDLIIDGGNSFYTDSVKRHKALAKKGIGYLDIGVSGGIESARNNACMMVGGKPKYFKMVEPALKAMCAKNGYALVGKEGAGHFVKMVHNGIEYGMVGAIAEGMQALKKHEKKFDISLDEAIKVYGHQSIIDSRLTGWLASGWKNYKKLTTIPGKVPMGETEAEMKHLESIADMKVLKTSRLMRVATRKKPSFAGKVIAAMRNEWGGHAIFGGKVRR